MEKDEFMRLKLQFAQADVAGKIALYTQTAGLNALQYRALLRLYPTERLAELERAVAAM